MSLRGRQIAQRGNEVGIEIRPDPLRCRLRFAHLPCSEGHTLDIDFAFSVHALDAKVERQMLAEMFLSDRAIATADEVARHFEPVVCESARRCVAEMDAEQCVSGAMNATILQALKASADAVAFNCGVEVLAPLELSIDSPTLRREKLEATTRAQSERRAAGQVRHVQQAAELLRQFESLRQAAPQLSPGQLLSRINEADRGSMLQTLLQTSLGRESKLLWVVAGSTLLRIDPRAASTAAEMIEIPAKLGPFRSVRPGRLSGVDGLLIGAQAGVIFVDPGRPGEITEFPAAVMTSSLGFNSAASIGDHVWASHSEAGVVCWTGDDPQRPGEVFADFIGAKNVTAIDDHRAMFSVAGQAFVVQPGAPARAVSAQTSAPIVLIAADAQNIMLVRSDGSVEPLDAESFMSQGIARRCGWISAAGVLPWLGSKRLLLADEDGSICCLGMDDALMTQYASQHRGLRALSACADVIGAISADRQRIVLWNSWQPSPIGEIHLASLARHRAGDLCFA